MNLYESIDKSILSLFESLRNEVDIAYPNTVYQANADTAYIESFLLNITNTSSSASNSQKYEAIAQININVPINEGPYLLNYYADKVLTIFRDNQTITTDGIKLTMMNISRGPTLRADDDTRHGLSFYKTNLDVNFLIYSE